MIDNKSKELWNAHKDAHLALSAEAAAKYDELYEASNYATGIYMRYELDLIKKYIDLLPTRKDAVVLGSGTGRECFHIAKEFERVFGYDFAQEMVQKANENKAHKQIDNVFFQTLDVDVQPLPHADSSVSFINSAFGMGSFVLDPGRLFAEVSRVLEPGGMAIFSFYNSNALINKVELGWQPAISSRLDYKEELLNVTFNGKDFQIPVRSYFPQQVQRFLQDHLKIVHLATFPTITSIMPENLFKNEVVRKLCLEADLLISSNLELAAGPFIIAVCEK
jgi:SAM-dependent methyltransferase